MMNNNAKKNWALFCAASLGAITLMGCAEGMARIHAAGDPVVEVSADKRGAFGRDVRQVRAPLKVTKGRDGECWDYQASANGASQPYYVVIGPGDRVGNRAFRTCAEAIRQGEFR
ncbi:hypothetical protein J8I26_05025 [Herbaspirillum sp. LeCh32-8]|uniref:hypothetical protein n=1 Tax=Herbaspirillum sp. LeCh32-8 TaxID=2821356 RepID=UPI001AEAA454|nr:hypothetical protein [Herbaspirillum sp. LeCh32-8]MBP0597455.1 hypothetical protein [Herbaspirillum sp. LeCh32-8]